MKDLDSIRDVTVVVHTQDVRLLPITNADRIRAMSDEELAEFLWSIGASPFNGAVYINGKPIFSTANGNKWLDWLKSPAEDGDR